jgi:hypothetical protein
VLSQAVSMSLRRQNGVDVQEIQPSLCPEWNILLKNSPAYSVFHTAEWADVLAKTYSYRPLYLVQEEGKRFMTLLPLMEVDSLITGRRAVSLPFTDACPVIVSDGVSMQQLFEILQDLGERRKWNYVELRPVEGFAPEGMESGQYFVHRADLKKRDLFSSLKENTRRNIRKSIKNGVNGCTGEFY